MKYYIIFGPPGAGKGTQSNLLVEKYNLKHISTGELLRKEIEQKTELGLIARSIIESGGLVDDATILKMIRKEIFANKADVAGFIFDGFPRNLEQAKALDNFLSSLGRKVDAVISLEIDDDVMIKRIQHRAKIEDREDDMDFKTIQNRIITYHKKTEPLIKYYKEKGRYFPVNGESAIEEGFNDICKIINRLINNE
ncbi:MAG: adenylate kinase [Rikenellaceae bacterium]